MSPYAGALETLSDLNLLRARHFKTPSYLSNVFATNVFSLGELCTQNVIL